MYSKKVSNDVILENKNNSLGCPTPPPLQTPLKDHIFDNLYINYEYDMYKN